MRAISQDLNDLAQMGHPLKTELEMAAIRFDQAIAFYYMDKVSLGRFMDEWKMANNVYTGALESQ